MNQREAKDAGREHGTSAARYCEVGDSDRKQAGCECEAPCVCMDCLTAAAFESESNAREYSPWEFLAAEINGAEDRAEGLWEAYDAGVAAGIKAEARRRLRAQAAALARQSAAAREEFEQANQ